VGSSRGVESQERSDKQARGGSYTLYGGGPIGGKIIFSYGFILTKKEYKMINKEAKMELETKREELIFKVKKKQETRSSHFIYSGKGRILSRPYKKRHRSEAVQIYNSKGFV
jgi:hypothetical protein